MKNTLILGAGKMMEAILLGLKNAQVDFSLTTIYSPSGKSAESLAAKVGAKWTLRLDDVRDVETVWVGCKPQQLKDLAQSLNDLFKDALYVSVLAALPESDQLKILNRKRLIRVMPNIPVKFNLGVVLLSSISGATDIPKTKSLMEKLGTALNVSEVELEELTLLTGSGPAFFYEFTKSLSESFTSLDESKREDLARRVLLGAAMNASNETSTLETQINAVTSKGGVTIAVLNEWRGLNLKDLMRKGIAKGKERSAELKALLLQD